MKKITKTIIIFFIALLFIGIYYYVTLPAVNIHSAGFWTALMAVILFVTFISVFGQLRRPSKLNVVQDKSVRKTLKEIKALKIGGSLFLLVLAVYLIGNILSSPIVNAARYQKLMNVEESDFTEDIQQVSYNTIPLLDKDSATLLGNRKMGSMVDMVSQFEVSDDYTQINYQDKPVRVTPLVYANGIKWLTNHKAGIPAYIKIDMATQDTECVKLEKTIKYSKSEYFNHNIYRHLRFHYPTDIFDDQIFFEINDEGTPYWVCPVRKFNIGLFGGHTVGSVVLCNAQTGECTKYPVEDVPSWIDKVYSAELLTELYNYHGIYQHGFFNSILGQKDCLMATNGCNYIALEDDVWVYTGVTSVSGDQSNVGFVLMNQRTMETKYYKIEGAIEDSAMSSAEGQVQNLGYRATFPLLLNISDEPTYFMALKDGAGLVKKYAMVNVHKYQWVAIGDTVKDCEKEYMGLLVKNGISENKDSNDLYEQITGKITAIAPITIEGNTHYYAALNNTDALFDIDMTDTNLVDIIRYQVGDTITFSYSVEENGLNNVTELKSEVDNNRFN